MLRTDKPIYKVIILLNLLFIIAGVMISLVDLTQSSSIGIIHRVLNVFTLLFAIFYILYGYTKNAAGYYKLFETLYAFSLASSVVSGLTLTKNSARFLFPLINLLILIVMIFVKDIGKKKSLTLCGVIVILAAIHFILVICNFGFASISTRVKIVDLDIACLYGILTYAKYLDKAERGTN